MARQPTQRRDDDLGGDRQLEDLPGEDLVGVRELVLLHDRLDRQPEGGGDLAERVALLDLVEPGLRRRRGDRGRHRRRGQDRGQGGAGGGVIVAGACGGHDDQDDTEERGSQQAHPGSVARCGTFDQGRNPR
jgi:hypothetical protein